MHQNAARNRLYVYQAAQVFSVSAEDRYSDDKTLVVIKRMLPNSEMPVIVAGVSE